MLLCVSKKQMPGWDYMWKKTYLGEQLGVGGMEKELGRAWRTISARCGSDIREGEREGIKGG